MACSSCFETMFFELKDGALLVESGKITAANPAAAALFGFRSSGELYGFMLTELLLGACALEAEEKQSESQLLQLLHDGLQERFEWQYRTHVGTILWLECLPVHFDGSADMYVLMRDISGRKKLEHKLERQERQIVMQSRMAQMGEMLSMIAHQWRQPLGAMASTIVTLQTKLFSGELTYRYPRDPDGTYLHKRLARIGTYVDHLASTIDEFREFFKPDRGKTSFLLSDAAEKAIYLLSGSLEHFHIGVERIYKDKGAIESHEKEMIQVLMSLLGNAKEALLEREVSAPTIRIELDRVKNLYILSISDNAGGVDEAIMERIFEPYFSTKANSGSGLGLYMSKIIIEEHCRGNLLVQNTPSGAKFSMILPAH